MYGGSQKEMSEFKHMVMSFRVAELRVLLSAAGRNKSGRKHDLMTRALQMLKNECNPEICKQIKLLYTSRYPRSTALQYDSIVKPYESNTYAPSAPVHDEIKTTATPVPVKFAYMPFYEVLSEAIRSSPLKQTGPGYFDGRYPFRLSHDMVDEIKTSSSNFHFKSSYQVQVQLRFCMMPSEGFIQQEQKDCLPPALSVKVNRKCATLPPFLPPTKAGQDPRRADRAIDITEQCDLYYNGENVIDVSWTAGAKNYGQNYVMCVNVVRKLSHTTLLNKLKKQKFRRAGHSQQLIRDKLTPDPESEISATSLKVSLLCPLGKMRMITPGRPVTCTHIQCFDLSTFLQMNEKRPTWMCPVCDKPSAYKNLIIDELFVDVLQETKHDEIVFTSDGSWQPLNKDHNKKKASSPNTVINEESSLICSSTENSPRVLSKSKEKSKVAVIDLTLDSDDDDQPISQPCKYLKQQSSSSSLHTPESTYDKDSISDIRCPSPLCSHSPFSITPNRNLVSPTISKSSSSHSNTSPVSSAIGSLLNFPSMVDPIDFSLNRASPFFNPYQPIPNHSMYNHDPRMYSELFMSRRLMHPGNTLSPASSFNDILQPFASYSPLPYLFPPSSSSNTPSGMSADDVMTID